MARELSKQASFSHEHEKCTSGSLSKNIKPASISGHVRETIIDIAPDAVVQPPKASFKNLFLFTRISHAWPLIAAIVAAALAAGFKTVLSVVLGEIFDVIGYYGAGTRNGDETLQSIGRWSLILIGLGIGNLISNSAFLALWVVFGELQASSVRQAVFNSLLSKDMSWFDSQKQGISSLLVRIQTQTRDLQNSTAQVFGLLVCDVMTALASLAIALYYSWKLTLVLLATLPVSVIILSLATRKLEPAIQAQRHHLATASKHATASLAAIDLVKIFNGYDHELRQYSKANQLASRHYLVQAMCNSTQIGYVAFWVIALFVVGFWYGVVLVEKGLSPGTVLTTFYATLGCIQGLEALMPHWLVIAKGMSAGAFLHSVIDERKDDNEAQRLKLAICPAGCKGDVELTGVSFAYPSNPRQNALSESSFFFPAGEITYIVGRSGSGKSTIGNLLAGFYKPVTGTIRVDGRSTEALNPQWLQENITLIQQSSVLFNATFFANIALGHPQPDIVSHQQVMSACHAVLLDSTIAGLPHGMDTNVGTDGHSLSGGQKQRLALARAWLKNPQVLILDEITSGLDQTNRTLVMASLREWRRGKTTIIITHDVHQIEDRDFVYVMDASHVVQKGFKRDLLRQEGHLTTLAVAEPQIIPEIEVVSPDTQSPDTPVFRSKSSRMADFFLDALDNNTRHLDRSSKRISIGASTAYAFQLRSDQAWTRLSTAPSITPSSLIDTEESWESERKRFSRFVSERFLLSSARLQQNDQSLLRSDTSHVTQSRVLPRIERIDTTGRQTLSTLPDSYKNAVLVRKPESNQLSISTRSALFRSTSDETITMDDLDSQRQLQYNVQEMDHYVNDTVTQNTSFSMPEPNSEFAKDTDVTEKPQKDDDDEIKHETAKRAKKKDTLFTALKSVWPSLGVKQRMTLLLGIAACVVGAGSTPVFSYCFAQLLGVMTEPGDKAQKGTKWAVIMLGVAITDGLGYGGGRYLLEKTGQAWVTALRVEALKRILAQPKPWFSKTKSSPGRITECLDRNAEEMRNIVGKFVPIIIAVIIMIGIAIIWSLAVSWKLTLASLAPLPVVAGAIKGYTIISGKWERKCNKGAEDSSAMLTEIFLNIRVVRALALEEYFSKKYLDLVATTLGLGMRRGGFSCGLYGLYQSFGYALTALVFYYGTVLLVTARELSIAEVMLVVNLLLFSIGSASSFLSSIPALTMAQATASQMLEYTRLSTEPPEGQRGTMIVDDPVPVEMKELKFSYAKASGREVLQGTSLTIQPGKCTAIVGHSGCGKSTIISLLMGLYTPNSSAQPSLTYSGEASTTVDVESLRSSMAYVSQAPFLFPASIGENITYGLAQESAFRSPSAITRAAEAAGIHDWIMSLPQGYDTLVGEGGQALSGGQAQRISIARALMRRPKLLVLDEPTSALDAESADIVRKTIADLSSRADMAIVLVTHSREMMRVADWIVMLGEGGIKLEEGTFSSLWERNGPFRALVGGAEADPYVGKGKKRAV